MYCIRGLAAAVLSAALCSASFAQITGFVKLEGKAPDMPQIKAIANDPNCSKLHKDPVFEETVVVGDKGELANVVVSIKPADGQKLAGTIPAKPAVLDQKGCMYHPHVIAVMVGQDVTVKSSDPFLHNVHALCIDNDGFNFGQPAPGSKKIDPFKTAETFKIKCDVHPWMAAWVRVLDNPFFAVTGEDGKYSIDTAGLADGDYTLTFWQEKYGEKDAKVTVKNGKGTADFSFKAEEKADAGPNVNAKSIVLAAADGSKACCDSKTAAAK